MSRKSTGVKQTVKFTAAKAAETVKEAGNTVKEVASKTAEAAKETVKVASEKAAEVKETAKEESKKVADKATETKDTVKKAVKKTAAKVTEKKNELVSEVYVQFAGQEAKVDAVIERATQAYVADGHRASSIKFSNRKRNWITSPTTDSFTISVLKMTGTVIPLRTLRKYFSAASDNSDTGMTVRLKVTSSSCRDAH